MRRDLSVYESPTRSRTAPVSVGSLSSITKSISTGGYGTRIGPGSTESTFQCSEQRKKEM